MSEIETEVVETTEAEETPTEETTEVAEETVETPEEKPSETLEAKRSRLARELKQTEKKLGITPPKPVEKTTVSKRGELDETQLDYLDLKGVTDEDEIEVIQKVMQKTGQTVRQALKDDYVTTKLATLRKEREVKDATPSGTRRVGGQSSNDVDYWVAKVEQGGELPKDVELKRKVINKIAGRDTLHTPPWRR